MRCQGLRSSLIRSHHGWSQDEPTNEDRKNYTAQAQLESSLDDVTSGHLCPQFHGLKRPRTRNTALLQRRGNGWDTWVLQPRPNPGTGHVDFLHL